MVSTTSSVTAAERSASIRASFLDCADTSAAALDCTEVGDGDDTGNGALPPPPPPNSPSHLPSPLPSPPVPTGEPDKSLGSAELDGKAAPPSTAVVTAGVEGMSINRLTVSLMRSRNTRLCARVCRRQGRQNILGGMTHVPCTTNTNTRCIQR